VPAKRLTVWVGEDVYLELVRRYGVRGLSRGVDGLLRQALFGEANAPTEKATSGVSEKPTVELMSGKTTVEVSEKAVGGESERTTVEESEKVAIAQPPSPPAPAERGEAKAEAPPPAGRLGRPDLLTAGQLDFIRALLERNRWSWLDVKDVLEFDTGLVLPDDPSQLTREAASRVIDALRSWERKPSSEELRKARQIMAQLPKEALEQLNLPERTSDVKRYHVVLLEKVWAKTELERAKRGGGK
jgi:hypothetical protein